MTNEEKSRARSAVASAVASGRLKRQPCERCGASDGVQGHHEDYSRPLDVTWLCVAHHRDRHRELGTPVGRPPTSATGEVASERVAIRLKPSQLARWRAIMEARGIDTIKDLVVAAMEYAASRREDRREEGELADLGREMLQLVRDYDAQR